MQAGTHSYRWIDDWAALPASESSSRGWAHTEIVMSASGRLLTGDPGEPKVLVYEPDGSLSRSFAVPVVEVHGMLHMPDQGHEVLWIADIGRKRRPERNYENAISPHGGQVIAVDLEGHVLAKLPRPDIRAYEDRLFAPTMLDIEPDTGNIWVADGYGQSLVHRYDRSGNYAGSLSGEEENAAGRFNCPHCVFIDRRRSEPELYVADRGNRRIQVYDLSGRFKRAFGKEFMTGPTDLLALGDHLVVVEYIDSGLTMLNADDRLIGRLGENVGSHDREGWPNSKLSDGTIVRNDHLVPGKFMSAHSAAADQDANLYVTEFLIGGRITKLERL